MKKTDLHKLDKNMKHKNIQDPENYTWLDAGNKKLSVKGLPWYYKNKGTFCRLPLKAEKLVRSPVWSLSQAPAGGYIHFKTDATSLAVQAKTALKPSLHHMPASGSNGLFLYCGEGDKMRPWGAAIPALDEDIYDKPLFEGIPKKIREYKLYLPLYSDLLALTLGFNKGARILKPSSERLDKPVVFYGTSITQGGCASNPGSDFVSIIGRNLNIETINLGFSGNGRGEPELAELLTDIDASMYVVDYVRNGAGGLKKTLPKFIKTLRAKKPKTPIMLLSASCAYSHDYEKQQQEKMDSSRDIMMHNYLKEKKKGDANIYFVDGYSLIRFGDDGAYVDNAHPTTHGFFLMARRLKPFIEMILLRDN